MDIDNSSTLHKIDLYQQAYPYATLPDYVKDAYENEMLLRLSWNTNHLEGNTLSLNETIDVIEYDEVRSGHTYTEYSEAKSAYRANRELLNFQNEVLIDAEYIRRANALIMNSEGNYRTTPVYIGTLAEIAFTPASPEAIPDLMKQYIPHLSQPEHPLGNAAIIHKAVLLHMQFERIHPFQDGNGRTGRLFINQYLLNQGLPPVIIENNSKYRQAFRFYDRNKDTALMEHCFASGILKSLEILKENCEKLR